MPRTHEDIMASLPEERRERIKARAARMHAEVEGLKALRLLADRSQEQIAQALGVKQPSVLKIERRTDLYLSTLRRFVETAAAARCAAVKSTSCTTLSAVQTWTVNRGAAVSQLSLTTAMVTVSQSATCHAVGNMAQVTITMPYANGSIGMLPAAPSSLVSSDCFPLMN